MKQYVTLLLLILAFPTLGQSVISQDSKEHYLELSRKQRKTGWILLASGAAATVVGLVRLNESWDSGSYTETDIYGFVTLGGIISSLVSIPYFINSGKNARKAASLSIGNQALYLPQKKGAAISVRPAARITIIF